MITVETLKRIIVSQKEEYEETVKSRTIIEREMDSGKVRAYLSQPNALAILGARRCGKSTYALQLLAGESFGYINFDDERLIGLKAEDLDSILEAFYELYGELKYFIFDEVQNVTGWELFVNRLRRTRRIIITGSNSRMLSGELSSHLTGRHIHITLFPFSFGEFLSYNAFALNKEAVYSLKQISETKRMLLEYLGKGGFPECYSFGREMAKRIYADIIEKDIAGRHEIRYKRTFKEMLAFLAGNAASEITARKLGAAFGIKDQHTVKNYLDYAFESYLFFVLERFSFKLKQRFMAPRKIYLIDTGIINAISLSPTKDSGRLMENLAAVELFRRKHYFEPDTEIFYWKDHQHWEVDFVVKRGKRISELIQVCHNPEEPAARSREIRALLRASEELKCSDLKIISWEQEREELFDGKTIRTIPLWKWLLRGSAGIPALRRESV